MSAYPKRLIEVDLPIKRISAHARREKSIRHGHISTLHIWWARRPLAACRAVLCAALWPDPADELCPQAFRETAVRLMHEFALTAAKERSVADLCHPYTWSQLTALRQPEGQLDPTNPAHLNFLRRLLLHFIADFANWDASTETHYLATARALTQAAHEALGGAPGTRPLVVDPFAGGGAIPLEALRVGADAFASDLNPVAVLLNKVVLEYIPKYGQRLADEVRKWGAWVKEEAEKELAEFYPCLPTGRPRTPPKPEPGKFYVYVLQCADQSLYKGQTSNLVQRFKQHEAGRVSWTAPRRPVELVYYETFSSREEAVLREKYLKSGSGREWLKKALATEQETPIAYLWARTIRCEGPGCGAEVPLMRGMWLSKKKNRPTALRMILDLQEKRVDFEIIEGVEAEDVGEGTVRRGSATCPVCGFTTPVTSVRQQLSERRGGAADARLFAVVTNKPGQKGRFYRLPVERDLEAVRKAATELERRKAAHTGPLSLTPNEPTPMGGGSGAGRAFSQRNYGMDNFEDLFTPRQLLTLTTLVRLIGKVGDQLKETDAGFAEAINTILGLALSRFTDICNSLCMWETSKTQVRHLFTRQALPILWDFAEPYVFADAAGNYNVTLGTMIKVIERSCSIDRYGVTDQVSANTHPLPNDAAQCFFTDPPYYDAVPYADLSDFFYVWLKRTLPSSVATSFTDTLVPKSEECIVDEIKGKDKTYFETTMSQAMAEGRRVLDPNGVGLVVFAHKTTTGWVAQVRAMIDAGWIVTGSWPIDTEMGTRLRARDSAALASSVHIVCRPRENLDGSLRTDTTRLPAGMVGEWRDVLNELPARIHEWMPRLADEGVVGADAIFACLGPALEIYSRYSRVERANGAPVPLGDVTAEDGSVVERGYLSYVWEAVSKEALAMIFASADTAGFEADARLTAMWLWTLSTATGSAEPSANGQVVKSTGYTLEYDAARKIAQGLGAHLERLGNLVEVKGNKARLLPVAERTRALFGKEGPKAPRRRKRKAQMSFLEQMDELGVTEEKGGAQELGDAPHGATVLDRMHQAMLLFASGRSEALRRFLVEEGVGQETHFWRLAQAFSALYPPHTDEKRWVDGVLARKKGLGF